VDQYSSSTYPRQDYKREGHSYKPHSRKKTFQKIFFAEPIVCKPTFSDLKKFITIVQNFIDGEKDYIHRERERERENLVKN